MLLQLSQKKFFYPCYVHTRSWRSGTSGAVIIVDIRSTFFELSVPLFATCRTGKAASTQVSLLASMYTPWCVFIAWSLSIKVSMFLTSALHEWSATRPGRFNPRGKRTWVDEPQSRFGRFGEHTLTSGFRRDADEICTFLGYYGA
jgi:hypothetical protein